MKLSIPDRFAIQALYPREATIVEQLTIKGIQDKIKIDQAEAVAIELKQEGQQIRWNDKLAKDLEIKFSPAELSLLKGQIDKMDKERKVTLEMVELCVKIQGEK